MRLHRLAAILLITLSLAPGVSSGSDQPQRSFVLASANTRSTLTDQDAVSSLGSFEQTNATAVADRISCLLTRNVHIGDALGIFDDSSENSFIVEIDLPRLRAEYIAALLGRYAHQQFVLLFVAQPGGHDKLWIIKTNETLGTVIAEARKLHLTPLTVRNEKDQREIWLVEKGEKHLNVDELKTNLKATGSAIEGSSDLVGDDDRSKSAAIFQKRINTYEEHHTSLSPSLWTRSWHDAATPTCSTKLP